MIEQAIQFSSRQDESTETLVGILCPANGTTGLLVVVGGPQYRVGSHRQFVKLCRAAASQQIPSMRFDVTGMGDSTGEAKPFYQQGNDIHAAIAEFFCRQTQLKSVVLWGLCDGASAILLALRLKPEPRVAGLVLLNPWVRQQQSYAKTIVKHYYLKRLVNKEFWEKLVSGKFSLFQSISSLLQNLQQARIKTPRVTAKLSESNKENYVIHMQQSLEQFTKKVCLITSGEDLTAQEFLDLCRSDLNWKKLLQQSNHHHISSANHTFSNQSLRQQVEEITISLIKNHTMQSL